VVTLSVIAYLGAPIAGPLTGLELVLLAFTIVVLTLLTEHSTRRSSRDIQSLVEAARSENRTLIEESKTHWSEQNARLDNAIDALKGLAVLQTNLIAAVKQLGQAQQTAVELQTKELEDQREARRREIESQRPTIDVRMRGWDGVIKHFKGIVSDPGPPGADLDVTFSLGGISISRHAALISKGAPFEPDFGDIGEFAESGQVLVTCEVSSSTKAHRYRFEATYDYERNKGFWGSSPTLNRTSPRVLEATILF